MKFSANIYGYTIVTNVWISIAVGGQQLSGCPQDHQILLTWNQWSVASSVLFHFHEPPIHEYHISDEKFSSTKSWNIEIQNIPSFVELCIFLRLAVTFCISFLLSSSSSFHCRLTYSYFLCTATIEAIGSLQSRSTKLSHTSDLFVWVFHILFLTNLLNYLFDHRRVEWWPGTVTRDVNTSDYTNTATISVHPNCKKHAVPFIWSKAFFQALMHCCYFVLQGELCKQLIMQHSIILLLIAHHLLWGHVAQTAGASWLVLLKMDPVQ